MASRTGLITRGPVIAVALGSGNVLSLTSGFSDVLSAEHTALTTLVDLNSMDELSVMFDEGDGSIRAVLLLSPT